MEGRMKNGGYKGHTAASKLAGDSSLGEDSMEITETRIDSTVCTGNHLSLAFSYPHLSSPGACKIDMHTVPSSYTFGWYICMTCYPLRMLSPYPLYIPQNRTSSLVVWRITDKHRRRGIEKRGLGSTCLGIHQ